MKELKKKYSDYTALDNTWCFKKSFTTLKTYIYLFRGYVLCFELS
jgi:hypothetical protein